MDTLTILQKINTFLWNYVLLFLLLGAGILFTIRLRFIQIRKFPMIFKYVFRSIFKKKKTDGEGISSFQALSTAIAAQVGTGNLAGVATAIAFGGPGAIFWMWVSALFGMGTIFAEAVLAQKFRQKKDGQMTGGPAYYIRHGLGNKYLAGFFAVSVIVALGFIGNMVQSNSIGEAFYKAFHVPKVTMGIIIATLIGLIIIGGIRRISVFAERVVPFMALLYIVGSVFILILYFDQLLPTFALIIDAAFHPQSAAGGFIGATVKEAIRYGFSRGLFSNEAGMGSTPHAHALAKVKHPAEQGMVAIMGVIIDTFIICTVTALVILSTGAYKTGKKGIDLTQEAFTLGLGSLGYPFIAICLLFFAFTTILGWYFFGEVNVKYLFGARFVPIYRVFVLSFIVLGTTLQVPVVWELADLFNGLMVIPNLLALLGLMSIVVKTFNDFEMKQ